MKPPWRTMAASNAEGSICFLVLLLIFLMLAAVRIHLGWCAPIWIFVLGIDALTILNCLMLAFAFFRWRGGSSWICGANHEHSGEGNCHTGNGESHDAHVSLSLFAIPDRIYHGGHLA